MENHRWNKLRPIAIAVVLAFSAEQAAFAAPAVPTIMPASLKPSMNFKLPQSVAVVDDAYKAPGDAKLLILIQDAHTNDSGQMNVAKALSEILPQEKIDTVFTEADSGDVSLNYIKPLVSQDVREKVGRQMVRRGELRGHDYANLTGPDFKLIGVEDPALYRKTLETYKDLTLKRDKVRGYVDRVQRSAEALKDSLFSDAMKAVEAKRLANAKGDLSLADYADTLLKESARVGLSSARYPHIKFLRRLRTIEKRVDFKKASAEERGALKALPFKDREVLLAAHKTAKAGAAEENGFYALFAEKLKAAGVMGQFPDLKKYFDYLAETRKMNALGVVGEVRGLEEELFLSLAKSRDEAVLWLFSRNLETLQNLINLKLSPEEFRRIRSEGALYDIKLIAGFLNRKIADLKLHYENALTLEGSYEAAWSDAVEFYELTLERDQVFLDRVTGMMDGGNIEKAVLITGGYHTPNLKEMLKASGYSYIALLPQVLHETDTVRYERLLLAQLKDAPVGTARIASGSRPARQEAAMTRQQPGVLAARLAAEVGDPGLQARLTTPVRLEVEAPVSAARMAEAKLDIRSEDWLGGDKQRVQPWRGEVRVGDLGMDVSIERFLSQVDGSPVGIAFRPKEGDWRKSDTQGAYETSWSSQQPLVLAATGAESEAAVHRSIIWSAGSDNRQMISITAEMNGAGDMNLRVMLEPAPPTGARMTKIEFPGFAKVEDRFMDFILKWTSRFPKGPNTSAEDRAGLAAFQPKPGHSYKGAVPVAVESKITPQVHEQYLRETLSGLVPVFFMAGAAMRFAVLVANKAKGTFSVNNLLELEPVFQQVLDDNRALLDEASALSLPAGQAAPEELLGRIKTASSKTYVSKIGDAKMDFNLENFEAGKKDARENYIANLKIVKQLHDVAAQIRADIDQKRAAGWSDEQLDLLVNFSLSTLQFASYVHNLRQQAGELFDLDNASTGPATAQDRTRFIDAFVRDNGQVIVSINEETGEDVISELYRSGFFGLDPDRVIFTVSPTLPVLVGDAANPDLFTFITPESARTRFGASEMPAHPYGHGFMVPVLNMAEAAYVVSVADSTPGAIKLRQLDKSAMDTAIARGGTASWNRNVDDLTGITASIPQGVELKHHPEFADHDGLVYLTFNASGQKGGGAVTEIDEATGRERALILEGPEIAGFLEILKAPIREALKQEHWTRLTVDEGLGEVEANKKIEELIDAMPQFKSISDSLSGLLNQMLVVDFDLSKTRERLGSIDDIYAYLAELNIVLSSKSIKKVPSSFIETFYTSIMTDTGRMASVTRVAQVEPNIALKSPVHAASIGTFPGFVAMTLDSFDNKDFADFVFASYFSGATLVGTAPESVTAATEVDGDPAAARLSQDLSAEVREWVLWAGQIGIARLDQLSQAQHEELAHIASKALAPNQTADVPMVISGEGETARLVVVQAQRNGQSIDMTEGATSISVGLNTLTTLEADTGRREELDAQAVDMSEFSSSLKALIDVVQAGRVEVPVHFRRSLDNSSVDQGRFVGDKITAFANWARQMALVYRLAHQKDNRIVLHLVTSALDPELKIKVDGELGRYESEGWLNLIREGDVDADELIRAGALLVDVKTSDPAKHDLAAGAHVVGRLTDGAVPDEAAAVAASLNTVGAVGLTEGASVRERFLNGTISEDAEALKRINDNYDLNNQARSVTEHVIQFRDGNLQRVTRVLKISIGRLLQTMRMMITQVAMAA